MKPLGYWLRHNHDLLEKAFDEPLAALGLTRRQWQVLNSLAMGARTTAEVDEALKPFVDQEGSMAGHLDELRRRGWLTDDDRLTGQGRQAHAEIEAKVRQFRARATAGIDEQDYLTTVRTLERMAENLG
ncbi:MarR family transcriptional regulator [Amycolatopsis rhabdoformis]|uniref:MarR family transcriptional regulator n=1 Tax=Amycolatopsis rhabdoformis TaxID=1448059 RepID=A0ABZ1I492_9PSEU|nr:MarR family transcriptional regulator [Amycolatopsis rhabdoformis]WSE28328.1 MarR family transcriptional regulator [Amycolatopsis rhabdoformis]